MHDKILEAFPFFSALSAQSREAFLARSIRKHLDHKQPLVRPGAECAYLPLVLEGALRVFKTSETGRELTLYRIERGESCILTATCILNGGHFPAMAEAEGPTEVLLVPSKVYDELVDASPEWRRFTFALYSKRLELVLTLVEEVAFHHVDSRIAAYLLKHSTGQPAEVRKTHGEIALELGTSREVVSRILGDFEAGGLILTERGRIRIQQPAALGERTTLAPSV